MKKIQFLIFVAMQCLVTSGLLAQNANVQLRSTMEWPDQTLANICGWTAPDGKEYALLGASKGMIIIDISNPDAPVEIVQIPGPNNLWKEIKTYKNFAYVTSEGGEGLQIVDLSMLPSPNLPYHSYLGDGAIAGQLNTIHALHVDVTKGFVYLHGTNLFSGGPVVCDLADPNNPVYVGKYDLAGYVHDGYADNDTLYAGHIYAGTMNIVDMTDKSNPTILGSVETPTQFTHNIWLTDNHKVALTTDETTASYLASYDISDPTDIKELDRFQTTPGSGSIVHNTHILNDWAISSWYKDGFNIVDVHRPNNLIQTGRYDTYNGEGDGFEGCWGVFPYFPSGTIVTSDIENPTKFSVFTPNYRRACYLEGVITDGCSNAPLSGAVVKINSGDVLATDQSRLNGIFRTGQVEPGNFSVTISKAGYVSKTIDVTLATAQVTDLNVTLEPTSAFALNGTVLNSVTNQPLANAQVVLSNASATYNFVTDANGSFNANCVLGGTYSASAGIWGFKLAQNVNVNANANVTLSLTPGYYDDFTLDYGWTKSATSPTGIWERGVPQETTNQNNISNPGVDSGLDGNDQCYVTGNGGGGAGSDDVDNGSSTLVSPVMKLSTWTNAKMTYQFWFFNSGGNGTDPNDKMEVIVSNGTQSVTVATYTESGSVWRASGDIFLANLLPLTDNMTVSFIATDDLPGHLVEGGVDVFEVVPSSVSGIEQLDNSLSLGVSPNPSSDVFDVQYAFPEGDNATIIMTNLLGSTVATKTVTANAGTEKIGANLPAGVYFVSLQKDGKRSQPVKVVKN